MMNVLQLLALATLVASLTRIQLSDESWGDRATREAINVVWFLVSWRALGQLTRHLPTWMVL